MKSLIVNADMKSGWGIYPWGILGITPWDIWGLPLGVFWGCPLGYWAWISSTPSPLLHWIVLYPFLSPPPHRCRHENGLGDYPLEYWATKSSLLSPWLPKFVQIRKNPSTTILSVVPLSLSLSLLPSQYVHSISYMI